MVPIRGYMRLFGHVPSIFTDLFHSLITLSGPHNCNAFVHDGTMFYRESFCIERSVVCNSFYEFYAHRKANDFYRDEKK